MRHKKNKKSLIETLETKIVEVDLRRRNQGCLEFLWRSLALLLRFAGHVLLPEECPSDKLFSVFGNLIR